MGFAKNFRDLLFVKEQNKSQLQGRMIAALGKRNTELLRENKELSEELELLKARSEQEASILKAQVGKLEEDLRQAQKKDNEVAAEADQLCSLSPITGESETRAFGPQDEDAIFEECSYYYPEESGYSCDCLGLEGIQNQLFHLQMENLARKKEIFSLKQKFDEGRKDAAESDDPFDYFVELEDLNVTCNQNDSDKEVQKLREQLKLLEVQLAAEQFKYNSLLHNIDEANDLRNQILDDWQKHPLLKLSDFDYEEAIQKRLKAIELEEKSERKDPIWLSLLWNDVSEYYFLLEKYERALDATSRAIFFNPLNVLFLWNRAVCHVKLGKHFEAAAELKRIVELNPNHEMAKKKLAELESTI